MQNFTAQNYPDGLSDGVLKSAKQGNISVKIFSSSTNNELRAFAYKDIETPVLVLLNESNVVSKSTSDFQYNLSILEDFKNKGYQILDNKFKPFQQVGINSDNIAAAKYLYKNKNKTLVPEDDVQLETQFKIWDPATGINIGKFKLHFYSLMFVFAFGFGYIIMSKIFKIDLVDQKYLEPFFTWTLVGTILGARLGHVIFYQPELFKEDFWSVFLPIRTKPSLEFTGFSGLASHGATIALIFTTLYYAFKIIKKNPFWVYDRIGIVVALGGSFVRLGNFFNSEIVGKPVDENSFFAMLFPQMSPEYGATVPRYPTQLFEAFGYVCLFFILWYFYKYTDKKKQQGWLFGLFFIILWAVRFFVEFLKEAQGDEFIHIGNLNTGQVLSIPFMLAGFVIMWYSQFNKEKKTTEITQ
jgi:prolipoprotein diacylglyceryl transferase